MASLQSKHRPRTVPRLPHRGTDPGTATGGEDSTFLRRSRHGGICLAAVVLIALIIFMIPALVAGMPW